MVKNPPAVQEAQDTWVQFLDGEDPLEKGILSSILSILEYSCLENPMDCCKELDTTEATCIHAYIHFRWPRGAVISLWYATSAHPGQLLAEASWTRLHVQGGAAAQEQILDHLPTPGPVEALAWKTSGPGLSITLLM